MRRLIDQRDESFAVKEATFARKQMNVRLASRHEVRYCTEGSASVQAFLRRKGEQGKGRRDL